MNIDTSTTAGKIAVMQAAEFGLKIENKSRLGNQWWVDNYEPPKWGWDHHDYRIAPGQDAKLAEFRSHLGAMRVGASKMWETRGGLKDERECGMNKKLLNMT